jgi:hypothetical protein
VENPVVLSLEGAARAALAKSPRSLTTHLQGKEVVLALKHANLSHSSGTRAAYGGGGSGLTILGT